MPHNIVNKWFTKALNGFNHSLAFTLQDYPANIRIKERNAGIVQDNCIACHQTAISEVYGMHSDQSRACTSCHENVGHENRLTN
jgi:cytochrome c nitrite reductase small subunit